MNAQARTRSEQLAKAEATTGTWCRRVDMLLAAPGRIHRRGARLASSLESLQHKRDSLVTKAAALRRHHDNGWRKAKHEFDNARRELDESWRSVITHCVKVPG